MPSKVFSPDQHGRRFHCLSVLRGIAVGLAVSVCWTALIGPLTDGPPSLMLSLTVYAIGFTITGAIVGAIRRVPGIVGFIAGSLTLTAIAIIVGPKDGWLLLWIMVFGGSGYLCGAVIGGLWYALEQYYLRNSRSAEPGAAADQPRD